ncbi:MAG TPA: sensor histidine kinase [Bryobacteraceae bacterium]|nr:sensor histidine kinase [Bryobacteraceae bacterium]
MERSRITRSAAQFGLGVAGLLLITLASVRLNLQPGAVSLLYLIAVVFVSLRAGFVASFGVSLIAVCLLQYYFVPLFSPAGSRNPLALVASIAFLVTASVITAMVSRVRKMTEAQLTVRFEERLAERTRIARELHDTLLQSFQALMLHFQSASNMLQPGPAKEALDEALDHADQAILEGRNAIQNLRSSTSVTNELAQAIAALGEELGTAKHGGLPQLNVSVEGKPQELHPILRDDIYRIAGEALRNAFHHARSTRIEAELTYSARLLRVRIRDNGSGIDPAIIETGREGHWGLQGMRERAQQIGAQLEIWSQPGAGTEVDLSVPGSVAYVLKRDKAIDEH